MKRILLVGALLVAGTAALAQTSVTIGGYGGNTDPPIVNNLINKFVKGKVAGVDVKYLPIGDPYVGNLTNQLSAGTAPDVFYLPGEAATGLIASGKILPLNGLVADKDFVKSLNSAYTSGGKLYGIAKDFNTLAMYYNKDLFDQAKVAYPTAKDSWDTYVDKVTKVQAALGGKDKGYYGACFAPEYARFGGFAAATGWKPFDAKNKTNLLDKRFVEAFTWYIDLVKKGVAVRPATISTGWGGECFKTAKVATAFEGAWMLGYLRDNAPNLRYGAVALPRNPTSKFSGNLSYTVAWAINADSKNKDAAVKVLDALTSKEAQQFILQSGLALPSRKALASDPYFKANTPEAQANKVIFDNASSPITHVLPFVASKWGDDWFKPINEAITSVMDNQASVTDALKKAQSAISALK